MTRINNSPTENLFFAQTIWHMALFTLHTIHACLSYRMDSKEGQHTCWPNMCRLEGDTTC